MDARSVADAFASALVAAGTRTVFGLPGGGNNLEVVGALEAHGIQFVLTHGETAATIMAAVYADVANVPSAAIITRGPGAASAVNGTAQALLDRQPVIVLTDTVAQRERPRILHQFVDQRSIYRPVTKGSGVLGAGSPGDTMSEALDLALAHPRGPVHLDFDPTSPERPRLTGEMRRFPEPAVGPSYVHALVSRARRPVVLLGVGARDAQAEVRDLLGGVDAPVLTTYRAKGVIPEAWSNFAGLLTGATVEAEALESADVIVAIGLDSVELIPAAWPYPAPLVALSAWPDVSGYLPIEHQLVGDLAKLVEGLNGHIGGDWAPRSGSQFLRRGLERLLREPKSVTGVSPQAVVRRFRAHASADTIATVDAGAHMLAVLPLWETHDRDQIITSSGLATMGFALPAAIGAAVAAPGHRIVCFVGDGGLGMTLAELETLVRLHLPVTVVVFNDSRLSLIAAKQTSPRHGGETAVAYHEIDFSRVAAGFGVPAHVASNSEQLDSAVVASLAESRPCLLDVRVDPDCYPLVLDAIRGPRADTEE